MFYLRVHHSHCDVLVAACDRELLGKTLRKDDVELEVSPRFYGDTLVEKQELLETLRGATVANLMGDEVVKAAQEAGLVDQKNTLRVCGIKHAQIVVVTK